MGLINVLRKWMGGLSKGMRNKWRRIFNRGQVAPTSSEEVERELQWVGAGFYVEDIFEHMVNEMKNGGADKSKRKFGFKTVAKVTRMGAKASKRQPRRKFTFKSIANVSRLGTNQTMSVEVPDK